VDACDCDGAGREATRVERAFIEAMFESYSLCGANTEIACSDYCVCTEPPAAGAALDDCLNELVPPVESEGWCYVSRSQGVGAEALLDARPPSQYCPSSSDRLLRVIGQRFKRPTIVVGACNIGEVTAATPPPGFAPLGTECLPSVEKDTDFPGFPLGGTSVEFGNAACGTGICVVNHLQGRVSCPYGQSEEVLESNPACFVPNSDEPVTVGVAPQFLERRSNSTATCSCRCDGPGPGPFCHCGRGQSCYPMIAAHGFPGEDDYVGSYCAPAGTQYRVTHPPDPETCSLDTMRCGDPHPY
jgi:hypothetical protein